MPQIGGFDNHLVQETAVSLVSSKRAPDIRHLEDIHPYVESVNWVARPVLADDLAEYCG
ncbi:MAG: hypothetical protein DHS20C20_25130 [Ardenticatenaceae bacterium]|nr:MAG: hypothetical protein DHS20C20_25130 [Ardenticatenaceae bacterium]